MQTFLITFLAFAALEMSNCVESESDEQQSRYFIANPKGLDYKFTGKKDKHSFGVELKENKQFHHTKTAEDGVRLGCYGHEQDGVKYSTHYVADGKGYRLVPHQGLITVYPKDGSEPRQASFVQSFNEDELNSRNIRYFFPDGCQSPQIEIDTKSFFPERTSPQPKVLPSATLPPASRLSEIPVGVNENLNEGNNRSGRVREFGGDLNKGDSRAESGVAGPAEDSLNDQSKKSSDGEDNLGTAVKSPDAFETSAGKSTLQIGAQEASNAKGEGVLNSAIFGGGLSAGKASYLPTAENGVNLESHGITPFKQLDNKCSDTCCDDNRPQILLSRATAGSCCKGVSKIVIPIDMDELGRIPMAEILGITSETKNVEMLQKLLKLVEKYKL